MKIFVSLLVFLLITSIDAATKPVVTSGDYRIQNFRFDNGTVLPELTLHYRTLCTPKKDALGAITNAVLLLHGSTGTGAWYLQPSVGNFLFAPGGPLDPAEYYILLPDAIGAGGSSKPSDGLKAAFPNYRYIDIIRSDHQLITLKLGVNHLLLVLGISMGGMHTWMWGEEYPEMADALMPIGCLPIALKGRNLLVHRAISMAIRSDPEWKNGNYKKQPSRLWSDIWTYYLLANGTPYLERNASSVESANAFIGVFSKGVKEQLDTNDYLYQIEAVESYNPQADLGKIQAKVYAVNFTGDEIFFNREVLESEITKVKNGEFVILPASNQTNGHLTVDRGDLWAPYVKKLLD